MQACLIADIVQHFIDAQLEFDASYVYQDVNRSIQHVHRSGLVHKGILSDPHRYLVKNVSDIKSCLKTCMIYFCSWMSIVSNSFRGMRLKHCSWCYMCKLAG